MASPSPFMFDPQYSNIDSFGHFESMEDDHLQFPYAANMPNQGYNTVMPHFSQMPPMSNPALSNLSNGVPSLSIPSGAYSLQAINMQNNINTSFQHNMFGDRTPPPLSASSASSNDSIQTTVSLADIIPQPPMSANSDSSLTALSRSSSVMSSVPSSPETSHGTFKRESSPISLHQSHGHQTKKRKTMQRGKAASSHLPPVITKPMDPKGPRITCATFVWPDVSGLSKKDARLVKNRAAAFLSRQRKREEFEAMEKKVAKLEQTYHETVAELHAREADLAGLPDLRDRLSKAEARSLAMETELTAKEKAYQAEITRLRAQGGNPASAQPVDVARLAVLFSLGSLSNTSSSSQLSISAPLPTSISGDVDLQIDGAKATSVDLQMADEDMDAEGSDDESAGAAKTPKTGASMRLTIQRPAQSMTTRRSRAAAASSIKEGRVSGQLELTPSSTPSNGTQRWGFKLAFGGLEP